MSHPSISVVLPTYNPHRGRLARTLAGLRAQTLPAGEWEFCIVDNNSPAGNRVAAEEVAWHPAGRVVFESTPGLTAARRTGIKSTTGELIIFVDDDNVLAPDYLACAATVAREHPTFGAFGGAIAPDWEQAPPAWTREFHCYLALRDLGSEILHGRGQRFGPEFTPNGAGMVLRRTVAEAWVRQLDGRPHSAQLGRTGTSLGAHEDLDLAWTSFSLGLEVAYVPALRMHHLIPAQRLTRDYLGRLLHGMAYSGQFFQAERSGQPPAPPVRLAWLRKLRRYLQTGAFLSPSAYIWWRHYCGILDARAAWHASATRNASPPAA